MTDKNKIMQMVYKSVSKRVNVTFEQFENILENWEFIPLTENGKLIGSVVKKDNELHIEYWEKAKSSILRHIRKPLKEAIEKYGFAETYVIETDNHALNFCKRLNFIEIGKDNGTILLRCHRSKYA